MQFPQSPSVNQTYTFNDKTWKWSGTAWVLLPSDTVLSSQLALKQPLDATLTALADAAWTSGKQILSLTGVDTVTLQTVGSAPGNVLDRAAGDALYLAIAANAASATKLNTARTIAITGDLAWTSPVFDGTGNVTAAGTLATVNSNVGSYGSATSVPAITVNAKGLITAVSSNTITAAGIGAIAASEKGAANGVATLGADSKIPTSQLPALAITSTSVAANQTAHLAVSAQEGDVVVRSDLNKSYIHNGGVAGTMADWQELLTPTDAVLSVAGKTGAVTLVKADVGLSNVDNTSDAAKPVSTAQQTALNLKLNSSAVSAYGLTLIDDADASTARTTLGLGTLATQSGTFSGTSSGTNTGDQTITLTGDITGSGTGSFAATLATVNSNVGSYGSATTAPILTVNAKGLITAVSTATITPAWTSITSRPTTVSGFGITDAVTTGTSQTISADKTFTAHITGQTSSNKFPIFGGFVLDTHPESTTPVIDPFAVNDIAYVAAKGGTVTTNHPDLPNGHVSWFDGQPTYGIFSTTNIPVEGMIITINLATNIFYGNVVGIHFGNVGWAASDITLEAFSITLGQWVSVDVTTGWTRAIYQVKHDAGAGGTSALRFTLKSFAGASGRIAQIYVANYNSKGSKNLFLGLDGGAMVNTTLVTNLNADLLDGQHGTYYLDAANLTGTISASRSWAQTGDITSAAGSAATTLATVNSNVGSFGSASAVPIVTVNAKGLVTAVSTAALGTAAAQNTGTSGATIPFLNGVNTWSGANTFSAKVNTVASATGAAGFNLPHGAAPTSPTNGDLWSTASTLEFRLTGATKTVAFTDSNITGSAATLTTGRTISTTGDVTYTSGSFNGSGNVTGTATIATNAVTLAKMAQVATATFLGRTTAATGNVEALTATQATALLDLAVAAGAKGLLSGADKSKLDGIAAGATANSGTVTAVSVTTANGVSGSVATSTTTPAITLTLGAITPSSVAATGTVTGTNLSGTNTGDQTITLTGDVTGSGTGSFAATVAAGAITLAKMASVATGTVFYRKTAATGAPEVQTLATLKTDLGLTGTNSGDQTIALTGDITGSGTGSFAATLATVNSNVGSYGSATSVPTITVNAKGLITAVSTSTITPAGIGAIAASEKGAANGVATLGADSKIPTSQLPALAITSTTVAANQAAQLAAPAEEGDVVVRTDLNKSYIHNGGVAGTMADWQELLTPTDAVLSVAGKTGAVTLVKADVGLSNVDNTSDAAKPVSTAQQTALNLKADLTGATFTGFTAVQVAGTPLRLNDTASGTSKIRLQNNSTDVGFIGANATGVTLQGNTGTVILQTASTGVSVTGTISSTGTISGSNLSGTNTGDQTITLTGNVTGSGTGSFATTIANNVVSNAMLAQVATATFKGRTTAATGNVEDLTVTQATALLNNFTSTLKGLAPASGGGTTNFLRADGTWAAPAGGTVTSVSVTTANGVSGTVATATTTPAITLTLGAITPSSVATGTLSTTGVGSLFALRTTGQAEGVRIQDSSPYLSFYNSAATTRFGYIQHSGTNLHLENDIAGVINLSVQGTTRASVTGSGLAVTGALSVTQATSLKSTTITGAGAIATIDSGAASDARMELKYNGTLIGSLSVGSAGTRLNAAFGYTTGLTVAGSDIALASSTGLAVTGTLSATSTISTPSSLQFTGTQFIGSGTGIWQPGAGEIGIVTAGSTTARFSSTGLALTGTLSAKAASDTSFGLNLQLASGAGGAVEIGPGWAGNYVNSAVIAHNGSVVAAFATTANGGVTFPATALYIGGNTAYHSGNFTTAATFGSATKGLVPASGGGTTNFLRADGTWAAPAGGAGTVTSVSVTTANGVSGTVATSTTTPAITLTLGAITPSSVVATGDITANNTFATASAASAGTEVRQLSIPHTGDSLVFGRTGPTFATQFGWRDPNRNHIYSSTEFRVGNSSGYVGMSGSTLSAGTATFTGNVTALGFVPTKLAYGTATKPINAITLVDAPSWHSVDNVMTFGSFNGNFALTSNSPDEVVLKIGANANTFEFRGNTIYHAGNFTSAPTFTSVAKGLAPASGGGTTNFLRADGTWAAPAGGSGTVTSVSVTTANGVSGTVATSTTTPAITLTLGAITPTNVTFPTAAGAGINFYGSNVYSVYMSEATNGTIGGRVSGETTSDYNIYFRMEGGGTNRGFVFRTQSGNVAGIDQTGHFRTVGNLTVSGTATFNGHTNLGDSLADIISVNGYFRCSTSGYYFNNAADTVNLMIITDAGLVTLRNDLRMNRTNALKLANDVDTNSYQISVANTTITTQGAGEVRQLITYTDSYTSLTSGDFSFYTGAVRRLQANSSGLTISGTISTSNGVRITTDSGITWASDAGVARSGGGVWVNTPSGTTGFLGHAGSGRLSWNSTGVTINTLTVSSPIIRSTQATGYLSMGYGSSNSLMPIACISDAYAPSGDTTMGSMYGIGYSYSGSTSNAFTGYNAQFSAEWGLYTAVNGVVRSMISVNAWFANSLYAGGNITAGGTVTGTSDARLKTNVERINDAREIVMGIEGVRFDWIDEEKPGRQIGFVAQNVQTKAPELVVEGREHLSLAYGNMTAVHNEALKELYEENLDLKARIERLEKLMEGKN